MKITAGTIGAMLVAGWLASSSVALAQDAGWYVGASIGKSHAREFCDGLSIPCDDIDTVSRYFGGYQFNRNLGVELGHTDLGTLATASGTVSGAPVFQRTEVTAWDLVGVVSYPIGSFSIYGKLGIYGAETDSRRTVSGVTTTASETNTDLTYGLGFGFGRTLGVRAEWQRYRNVGGRDVGEDQIDVLSVGLMYRF